MSSTRYSEDQRREFVQLYMDGGLSRSAFCKEMGISPMSLDKWLRDHGHSNETKFVEVERVVEEPGISLKVHLPGGLICEIGSCLNRAEVVSWIRDLKGC